MQSFHTKRSCPKPMLRQIEWRVQDGPVTDNRVLPIATLVLRKYCFSLRTSYDT